jgi:hypothetical protein
MAQQFNQNTLAKLVGRFRRTKPVPVIQKHCHFLAAPAEIRLLIYGYIAPDGFLPALPYSDYTGLFLSCKQICHEMSFKAVRAAPEILNEIHYQKGHDIPMKLRPLQPTNFTLLMHVTIGIPRWTLCDRRITDRICETIFPVFLLHLSSLTIGLEDLQCDADVFQMVASLDSERIKWYMLRTDGCDNIIAPYEDEPMQDHYRVRTTCNDIIDLASKINCFVAPNLCDGKHLFDNVYCLRDWGRDPPPPVPCNVRKVVLQFKKLHEEAMCACDNLPHIVYPHGHQWLRWSPTDEADMLMEEGWSCEWMDEKGVSRTLSSRAPAQFVWQKIEESQKQKQRYTGAEAKQVLVENMSRSNYEK